MGAGACSPNTFICPYFSKIIYKTYLFTKQSKLVILNALTKQSKWLNMETKLKYGQLQWNHCWENFYFMLFKATSFRKKSNKKFKYTFYVFLIEKDDV